LLGAMTSGIAATGRPGRLAGDAFAALREIAGDGPLAARVLSLDQTNSSVVYGDRFLLKLFRVVEEGPSAELEIGRFLANHAPDHHGVPRLAGVLEYREPEHEASTLGVLYEYVANQGDAWQLAKNELDRYYDRVLTDERHPAAPRLEPGTLLERARTP